jgi:hypothetical protein
MIGPKDFHVEVSQDDVGLLVTVTHVPTKQTRHARPKKGESCFKVESRLRSEITATFLRVEDFLLEVGRCEVDGKFGGFYRVTHEPSGRSKRMDTITSPNVKHPQQFLFEALLEELWRDGALPLESDAESPK